MFSEKFGKNKEGNIWIILMYLFAIVFLLAILFPYVYMLLSSFKPGNEVISSNPTLFPSEFSLENYKAFFSDSNVLGYFRNSLLAATISTVISVGLGSMAAFSISRTPASKYSNFLLLLVLSLQMIPMTSLAVPIYSFVQSFGYYDYLPALIVVYSAVRIPFVLWMLISFFEAIPMTLDESAAIDGASAFKSFRKVIFPVAIPGIVSTSIFTFLFSWNDFLLSLLLTSNKAKTAPVALSEFLTAYSLDLGPMTAGAVLFSFPLIIISFFLQRYLVSGIMSGSIKG